MNEYKVTTKKSTYGHNLYEVMLLRWDGYTWKAIEGYVGRYDKKFAWQKDAIARDKMRRLPVAGTTDNEQVD